MGKNCREGWVGLLVPDLPSPVMWGEVTCGSFFAPIYTQPMEDRRIKAML